MVARRVTPERIPLLEREAELHALVSALDDARGGQGRLVAIEGPAGVGKSRLLEEAVREARGSGLDVLRARGGEGERDFPFGIALQLIEPVARATAATRAKLTRGAAAASAALLDGSAWERLGADPSMLFMLVHALYWLTSNLADRRPLLVAVDDIRYADAASLRYLRYLAHRIADLPVALVVALRTGEPLSVREDVLALVRDEHATTLAPSPLGAAAAAAVVRRHMPGATDDFCAACSEATGGNPFLLRELLLTLSADGVTPTGAAAPAVRSMAPESVSRSILVRLARFSPEAVALGRAVAVLGDAVALDEAAAVAQLDRPRATELAAQLARAGVLGADAALSFAHPLLQTAVLADMTPLERSAAHARAARVLHDRGRSVDLVAAHLLRAPAVGEPWAVETLRQAAAHSAGEGTPGAAAERLRRALQEPLGPVARTEIEIALGRAELAAGTRAGAERIEGALRGLPARRQAALLLELGQTLHVQERPADAAVAFTRGLALVDGDGEDADLVRELRVSRALAGFWAPDHVPDAAEAVAPLLDEGRAPAGRVDRVALVTIATADLFAGRDREQAIERAWRAWGGGAWLADAGLGDARIGNLVGVLTFSDAFDRSLEVCERLVSEASTQQMPVAFATAVYLRGILQAHRGRLAEAAADLEQSLEAEALGWAFLAPTARGTIAVAQLLAGDPDGAERVLRVDPAVEAAAQEDYLYGVWWLGRGWLALARGDAAAARRHFEVARGQILSLGDRNPAMFNWHSGAALAALRLGDERGACELADGEVALARAYGAPRALALALRTRALVEPPAGGRLPWLEEAAAVIDGSDALAARAQVLTTLGAVLRRERGNSAAREPLRAGLEAAHRAGADAVARQAREELALAGVRSARPVRTGADALTPGELRVARLAARGLTNREIAEALFVTRKTVEWHLRGTYRKLGVNDRQALRPLVEAAARAD